MAELYVPYNLSEDEAAQIAGYRCGVCGKPLTVHKPVVLIPARGMTAWTEETELIHLICGISIIDDFEGTDLQKYNSLIGGTNDMSVSFDKGTGHITLTIRNVAEEAVLFIFNVHGTYIRFMVAK